MQKILDKYLDDKSADDYVLNIIKLNLEQAEFLNISVNPNHVHYEIGDIGEPFTIELTPEIQSDLNQNKSGKSRKQYLERFVIIDQIKKRRKRM